MKIIILHGDYEIKSYQRLSVFINVAKRRNWEVVRLENKGKLSLEEQLSASSLFGLTKFFILENGTQINKKGFEWLGRNAKNLEGTLVIYKKGTIAKTLIKKLPQPVKVEEFKLPKLIWTMLDSIQPANSKNSIYLLHEVIKTDPIEFLFSLVATRIRDLYWVKVNSKSLPYPSWRVGKLKVQASKFDKDLLEQMIKDLAEIDIQAKLSKVNLTDSLDFVLVTRLE